MCNANFYWTKLWLLYRIVLPTSIQRHTVLKSPHIYKKHRAQYEVRTHARMLQVRYECIISPDTKSTQRTYTTLHSFIPHYSFILQVYTSLFQSTLHAYTTLHSFTLWSYTPLFHAAPHSFILQVYTPLFQSTLHAYTTLHYTLLHYAFGTLSLLTTLPYYTLLFHIILHSFIPHSTLSYRTPLFHTTLHSFVLHFTLSYHTPLHSFIPHSTLSYCTPLFHTTLYSFILHPTLSYCIPLFHTPETKGYQTSRLWWLVNFAG